VTFRDQYKLFSYHKLTILSGFGYGLFSCQSFCVYVACTPSSESSKKERERERERGKKCFGEHATLALKNAPLD
jgi:hypothetical protein